MSNNYFQFKQFKVEQQDCAMKVCTDACLFGAWIAGKVETMHPKSILDIGTGTGLLTLMLAQKSEATIDAVELDEAAAEQAKHNFEASSFKERLTLHNISIQNFDSAAKYDLIISNPPFFSNDLKSIDAKRNLALHNDSLSLEELITSIKRLLDKEGNFAVLLPTHRSNEFKELAQQQAFYLQEEVMVKQTEKHAYFRTMLWYSRSPVTIIIKEITIKKDDKYSTEFIALLKDYYLFL